MQKIKRKRNFTIERLIMEKHSARLNSRTDEILAVFLHVKSVRSKMDELSALWSKETEFLVFVN